jgi:hypothetical protein
MATVRTSELRDTIGVFNVFEILYRNVLFMSCDFLCGVFNECACVCVGFVTCGCFGNMGTFRYCDLCRLYCVFVLFRLCIFILI